MSEKGTHLLQIRLTKSQHERLKHQSVANGFNTLSNYVRTSLLNPSLEYKVNNILKILQEGGMKKES